MKPIRSIQAKKEYLLPREAARQMPRVPAAVPRNLPSACRGLEPGARSMTSVDSALRHWHRQHAAQGTGGHQAQFAVSTAFAHRRWSTDLIAGGPRGNTGFLYADTVRLGPPVAVPSHPG